MPDDPQVNPGIDMPYIVALPTYAATAWYHNRVANRPAELRTFLDQVEAFATSDYAAALIKGNELPDAERQRIAERLAGFHRPSVPYLLKTNLRIEYGAFQKELLGDQEQTTGTLDTRFIGATLDPLSQGRRATIRRARRSAAPMSRRSTIMPAPASATATGSSSSRDLDLREMGLQASAAGRRPSADRACPTCFPTSPSR